MTNHPPKLIVLIFLACTCSVLAAGTDQPHQKLYVPYQDIAAVIDPAAKAVLMDRQAFARLLAAAQANAAADSIELGQITAAKYSATVVGEKLTLTGKLTVRSLSDKPVRVPLHFAQIGLTSVTINAAPAPLGYDKKGRLVLVVTGKGTHHLTVNASAKLKELSTGGMSATFSLPPAVAAAMTLSAPGDLEINANVPVSVIAYDKQADRTTAELSLGGQSSLSIALIGNGWLDDQNAILIGEAATTVRLSKSYQQLHCSYTVQILRRGLRRLELTLPRDWTVTDLTSPNLTKWSVSLPLSEGPQRLQVHFRSPVRGTQTIDLAATATSKGSGPWQSPPVNLIGSAFQRGFLLVDPSDQLRVRSEKLTNARRQDASTAILRTHLSPAIGSRLYYHWGPRWKVNLDLAAVSLRTTSQESQNLSLDASKLSLDAQFQITALGKELYDLSFTLPPASAAWDLSSVTLNGKKDGFQYKLTDAQVSRLLKINLASPVPAEATATVNITLHHVPPGWDWSAQSAQRDIAIPLIKTASSKTAGLVSITPQGDLDASVISAPAMLEPITVGRMALLGLSPEVQSAYSYHTAPEGRIKLRVSRRQPRIAAHAVGLITAKPTRLTGQWRITYTISRAQTKKLYLLAEKSLVRQMMIEAPGRHIASKTIVAPGPDTIALAQSLAQDYNLWQIILDGQTIGKVILQAHYERPLPEKQFDLPLIRPIAAAQSTELLAIQAAEELALTVQPRSTSDIDAVDLPPLPGQAQRILAAFSIQSPTTAAGVQAAVSLTTTVHDKYVIPPALVLSADLTTYLDARGAQRTEAQLSILNAGVQFLAIRLPEGAQLWSVRLANAQVKPKRNTQGHYLLALPLSTSPQTVRVVYALPCPVASDNVSPIQMAGLALPGLQVNQTRWTVYPPPGYRVSSQKTRMQTSASFRPPPAYTTTLRAAGELLGSVVLMPALQRAQEVSFRSAGDQSASRMIASPEDLPAELTEGAAKAARPAPSKWQSLGYAAFGVGPAKGRYTLPVELTPTPGAGLPITFTAIGKSGLSIALTKTTTMGRWCALGVVLIAAAGITRLNASGRYKTVLILAVLTASSLIAIWSASATPFANGAFFAALALIPFYLAVGIIRWLFAKITSSRPSAPASGPTTALILAALLSLAASAASAESFPHPTPESKTPQLIIPYQGDPTKADQANKVLIPYQRYVELWNLAHPDQQIETPSAHTSIALAGARYHATVDSQQMTVTLTAQIQTFGRGWIKLPMPFENLAVTEATIDGKPAQLHLESGGIVLTMPAGISGTLKVTALTTPKFLGRTGTAKFSLPPLPAATLTVRLPQEDLLLEAPGLDALLSSRKLDDAVEWTVPLGPSPKLSLRWSPQAGLAAIDRTLSAHASHQVYVLHFCIRGSSKLAYTFSAGDHDRFNILLPAGLTVTDLTGANVRDFRILSAQSIDGQDFKLIQVRLHRPASKEYELILRWLGDLPDFDTPIPLLLPRTAGVGRESGTVTLHGAKGMTVKIAKVSGARRDRIDKNPTPPTSGQPTISVARYYWPYRPFSLALKLSRPTVKPQAQIDQLVRISSERIQLLVQARLKAKKGRIFDSHFALPDGYELLSAIGPAVADWYVQPTPTARQLHVNFCSGQADTTLALVLVRDKPKLGTTAIPTITVIDPDGKPLDKQTGRLAVQIAPALQAHTAASENLKSINPKRTTDWLDRSQVRAVQFAYSYEQPLISLDLQVTAQPTTVRLESFTGLTVQPNSAWYTYRLRYNIEGSPLDQVSFTLPSQYASLVEVASPSLRSLSTSTEGDRTRWTVSLVNQVTGLLDITVNFALPINPQITELKVPRIGTGQRRWYRAIIALQNDSRHELTLKNSANLSPLPLGQQRKLLSQNILKSLQFVYQSYTDDWDLTLAVTPAKPAKRIQAVVDLLALTTAIDRYGNCRYQATLSLQNRSEQFLRLQLPASLSLWSAVVAGQPVKPVKPTEAGPGQILIPLIKTSPGGLPYEVKLYLAGQPLPKFDNILRLQPPPINIVGIPVMRTTWSLQLPDGYKYFRPGGNLSEVAQEVQSAVFAAEATLEQLKRMGRSYRQLGRYASGKQKQTALTNLDIQSRKLTEQLRHAERVAESNRANLEGKDFSRLQADIKRQRLTQLQEVEQMSQLQQAEQGPSRDDLNAWLNNLGTNAGLAESLREQSLNTLPEFVQRNTRQQKQAMERSRKKLRASREEDLRWQTQPPVLSKIPYTNRWSKTESGPEYDRDATGQAAAQARNLERLDRYFDKARLGSTPAAISKGAADMPQSRSGRRGRTPSDGLDQAGKLGAEAEHGAGEAVAGLPAVQPGWSYVAKGTFSLPVQLPAGAIRRDFARPGGQAQLTIWAVRTSLLHKSYATAAVLLALAVACVLFRLLARFEFSATTPGHYIFAYVLLAVILLVLAGILGLFAALLIVCLVEIIRKRRLRSAPAKIEHH